MSLRSHLLNLALATLCTTLCLACGPDDEDETGVELLTLETEPAGAPADLADGRLTCLGGKAPAAATGETIQLLAWIRTWADPDNDGELQPSARVEALDDAGTSLGVSFSDTGGGRTTLSIPTRTDTFSGTLVATADGYLDWHFRSSQVYAPPASGDPPAGWAWLITEEELAGEAIEAGVMLEAGTGFLVGAVHDCDGFGVSNALIRWSDNFDGVTYLDDPSYQDSESGVGSDHFMPAVDATATAFGGRFVIPNVAPGTVTVEAFVRVEAGGPLVRMSVVDVTVVPDAITSVDLQPIIAPR